MKDIWWFRRLGFVHADDHSFVMLFNSPLHSLTQSCLEVFLYRSHSLTSIRTIRHQGRIKYTTVDIITCYRNFERMCCTWFNFLINNCVQPGSSHRSRALLLYIHHLYNWQLRTRNMGGLALANHKARLEVEPRDGRGRYINDCQILSIRFKPWDKQFKPRERRKDDHIPT